MADVFISYSRLNIDFTRRIFDRLKTVNRDSWIDWEGIPLSSDWWGEIKAGIEAADNFVFILSPESLSSAVCTLEVHHALQTGKRIIPVVYVKPEIETAFGKIAAVQPDDILQRMLGDADLLMLARSNWAQLGHINWIFFRDEDVFDAAFDQLIKTIETDLEHVRRHTRLLTRAREWQDSGQSADALLYGEQIEDAEAWLAQAGDKQPRPTDLHREYITRSREVENRRRRLLRNLRFAAIVATVVGTIAIGGTIFALTSGRASVRQAESTLDAVQRDVVQQQSNIQSLQLAQEAARLFEDGDPLLALPVALAANAQPNPPPFAQSVLADIAYHSGLRRTFVGHTDNVFIVAFSPDGTTALSGSSDQTLILWDVASGERLRTFEGHTSSVFTLTFSPDGQTALSGSDDRTLILWDVATGERLRTFQGHTSQVLGVAFSPDGATALSGSRDNTLILWDVATGERLRTFEGHTSGVLSVAFSPDGATALSNSLQELLLWDVTTGQLLHTFEGYTSSVLSVAFSPDGQMALSGLFDGTLILWDVVTRDRVRIFQRHSDWVQSVAFSPDGQTALSGSNDNTLILWDVATGSLMRTFRGHTGDVESATFSPDGRTALSGSSDDTLILWDVATGSLMRTFRGHSDAVTSVVSSPDGQTALSGSDDHTLVLWDVATGERLQTFEGHTSTVWSVAFSPDGATALSSAFQEVFLWDVATAERLRSFEGHTLFITSVAFSPDGRTAGSSDSTLILWDVATGVLLRTFEGLLTVAFSPDGQTALSGLGDSTLILWDVVSGEQLRTFEGHTGLVRSVAFNPDGATALSGSDDRTLILWDVATGALLRTFEGHTSLVTSVAFSTDGQTALSGSSDNSLILWDVASGERLRTFVGHTSFVNSVAFSPDGQAALSGSDDRTLIRWRIDTLDELIEWAYDNRQVIELDCGQRRRFGVDPLCAVGTTTPVTATPFITRTPTTTTTSPTPLPIWTALDSPTPSNTPTPTATLPTVREGSNRGEIEIGGGQLWSYTGRAGEIITIRLEADNPLHDRPGVTPVPDGFDTLLIVRNSNNTIYIEVDDILPGQITDSLIENLQLPVDGEYIIEVRSYADASGGRYTLTITRGQTATITPYPTLITPVITPMASSTPTAASGG